MASPFFFVSAICCGCDRGKCNLKKIQGKMKYRGSTSGALMSVSEVVKSQIMRKEVLADSVVSGRGRRRRGEPRDAVAALRSFGGVGSAGPEGLVRSWGAEPRAWIDSQAHAIYAGVAA